MIEAYIGRALEIRIEGERIATVQAKSLSLPRAPIDTSNEEDAGYRYIDPLPEMREAVVSAEGVASERNYRRLLEIWEGDELIPIAVVFPFGEVPIPDNDGAFMLSLEHGGQHDGFVSFSVTFLLGGVDDPAPIPPPPLPPPIVPPEPPPPPPILLSTTLYPVEYEESMGTLGEFEDADVLNSVLEEMRAYGTMLSAQTTVLLITYPDWPVEEIRVHGEFTAFVITVDAVYITYLAPPEEIETSGALLGVEVTFDPEKTIYYSNWTPEEMTSGGEFTGGELS